RYSTASPRSLPSFPTRRSSDLPLHLLVEELAGALVEAVGLAQALALGEAADCHAPAQLAHDDDPPRLHEPDGGSAVGGLEHALQDRKSTRLNSSHVKISYAVFC